FRVLPTSASRLIVCCYRPRRLLHSFPTRRSSDLLRRAGEVLRAEGCDSVVFGAAAPLGLLAPALRRRGAGRFVGVTHGHEAGWRSEEHTSELQSRENLVCRLLLEKRKKTRTQ